MFKQAILLVITIPCMIFLLKKDIRSGGTKISGSKYYATVASDRYDKLLCYAVLPLSVLTKVEGSNELVDSNRTSAWYHHWIYSFLDFGFGHSLVPSIHGPHSQTLQRRGMGDFIHAGLCLQEWTIFLVTFPLLPRLVIAVSLVTWATSGHRARAAWTILFSALLAGSCN